MVSPTTFIFFYMISNRYLIMDKSLADSLKLTSQQARIMEAIARLLETSRARPNDILAKESEISGKAPIGKSNFFKQLARLRKAGYVKRLPDSSYLLNYARMRESLEAAKEKHITRAESLAGAISIAEDYIRSRLSPRELKVGFLPADAWQDRFADLVSGSQRCYITGIFPKIIYGHSPLFTESESGRKYASKLWDLCIRKKRLEITYLTRLDVSYLFRLLRLSGVGKREACSEILKLLDHLELLLKGKRLKAYYAPSPYGIDMGIPDADESKCAFLFFRGPDKEELGSVHIDSAQLAVQFKGLFESECSKATDLASPAGKRIIEMRKQQVLAIQKKAMHATHKS